MRDHLAATVANVRAQLLVHPRHVVLGALVAGLLAGGWAPVLVPVAAVVAGTVAGTGPVALLAVLAALGGGAGAQARAHAITTGPLPARLGASVRLDVVLLEPLRERASGRVVARVAPLRGRARSEPLVLRLRDATALTGRRPSSNHGAGDEGGSGAVVERTTVGPGDVLAVAGRLERLGPWDAYQRRRGALAGLEAERAIVTGRHRGGRMGALDAVRRRAETAVRDRLPAREAELLLGMTLGRDDGIDDETLEAFRAAGLTHLLAVSGANVMLLCVLALAAMGVVGVPLRARLVVAIALVALYVPLTGAGPSIQRAGVMGACGLVAALAGRPSSRWYAVGFAAAVTLAWNPLVAADPGWQLSFAAVVGLLALAPRLRDALQRRRVPRPLAEAAAITLAATLATAPLLAAHFGQVSLASVPANLVVAPVVAPIMWLGTLAALAGQVAPALAAPATTLAAPLLGFVAFAADRGAALPGATLTAAALPAGVVLPLGYGLLGLGWWLARRVVPPGWRPPRGPAIAVALAACALLVLVRPDRAAAPVPRGVTVVSFLDVGQGDATVVQRDGTAVLVDTGPPEGDVLARLREIGVRRLDAFVITHAERDHEGAALEVVRALRPRVVVDGGAGWSSPVQAALPAAVRRAGGRIVTAVAGDELAAGPIRMDVLWPPERLARLPPEGSANDRALTIVASVGDFDTLLTADAEAEVTTSVDWPRVEALKVAHHGSADAALPRLLDAARPTVAAIEVGADNTYGHPTPATMAALSAAVPHVYRTDRSGTVRLFSGPRGDLRVEELGT